MFFKKFSLLRSNFIFVDDEDSLAEFGPLMDGFPEFVELIDNESRIEDLVVDFHIALDIPDKIILIELYLLFLFGEIGGRFVLLRYFMGTSHYVLYL